MGVEVDSIVKGMKEEAVRPRTVWHEGVPAMFHQIRAQCTCSATALPLVGHALRCAQSYGFSAQTCGDSVAGSPLWQNLFEASSGPQRNRVCHCWGVVAEAWG